MNAPMTDREQALRWLIDHRCPDISVGEALRILRAALPRDAETARLLHRIGDAHACTVT